MIRKIAFILLCILFQFGLNAQLLQEMKNDIVDSYDWILTKASSKSCNTTKGITEKDIIESNVNRCQFVDHFEMFPNPTDGVVALDFKAHSSPTEIVIAGLDGKVVYKEELPEFNGFYKKELILNAATKGIYLVSIIQNKEIFIKKLVLQ